jgi:hypothetical protein
MEFDVGFDKSVYKTQNTFPSSRIFLESAATSRPA